MQMQCNFYFISHMYDKNISHPRQCLQRKLINIQRQKRNQHTRHIFDSNINVRGKLLLEEIDRLQNSSIILRKKMIKARQQRAQLSIRRKDELPEIERYELPDLILKPKVNPSLIQSPIKEKDREEVSARRAYSNRNRTSSMNSIVMRRRERIGKVLQNLYTKQIKEIEKKAELSSYRRKIVLTFHGKCLQIAFTTRGHWSTDVDEFYERRFHRGHVYNKMQKYQPRKFNLVELEKNCHLHKGGVFRAFHLGILVGQFQATSTPNVAAIMSFMEMLDNVTDMGFLARDQIKDVIQQAMTLKSIEQLKFMIDQMQQDLAQHGEGSVRDLIFFCIQQAGSIKGSVGGHLQDAKDYQINEQEELQKYQSYLKLKKQASENQKLAMELMEKLNQEDRAKLIKKREEEESTQCNICIMALYEDRFDPLQCGHVFHQGCLHNYFKTMINQKKFPLKCPNEECKGQVYEQDLRQLLQPELVDKFIEFTLSHFADIHGQEVSWCPTADCKFLFSVEGDTTYFRCPKCEQEYCLQCRSKWHKNMTCKQYQITINPDKNDEAFDKFVKGSKFKICPGCKIWVQKEVGCDAMSCRCGAFFCYACGSKLEYDHAPCPVCTKPPVRPQRPPRRRK